MAVWRGDLYVFLHVCGFKSTVAYCVSYCAWGGNRTHNLLRG